MTFWPDVPSLRRDRIPGPDVLERLQVMAFLNRGLEIRFTDERAGPVSQGHLQVQRRHRRLREAASNAAKESLSRKVARSSSPRTTRKWR